MKRQWKKPNDPINVRPLRPEQIAVKYSDRRRVGKTNRDKAKAKP